MNKNYTLGIDLGTSNSALALGVVDEDELRTLPITQIMGPDAIGEKETLPSITYFPHQNEFPPDSLRLPWDGVLVRPGIVGVMAKDRGVTVPDRVVVSAKSWLCNEHVDRRGAILPWRSESVQEKYSPFEISQWLLEHLRSAFMYAVEDSVALDDCSVVLTVPASFDEVARRLTYEAAKAAGFDQVTLLEEPQAAFYSWIEQCSDAWRDEISPGDVVLICDVGGGTADFSLIAVTEENGELQLERISVGNHILLGGDNMDLALAFMLRHELESTGTKIDDWQFLSLTHSARLAKERLFAELEIDYIPISIPCRGASLFTQTISTGLTREQLNRVVVDGFFPITEISDMPVQRRLVGLQEYGLPYASDPIVSKHIAQFLVASLQNVRSDSGMTSLVSPEQLADDAVFLRPTAVLFNGGVFGSQVLRERTLQLLAHWSGGAPVRELKAESFDLAVARGAACYGRIALSGKGLRIRAGTARSYYLGIETSMLAVPGILPTIKGVCVVPQGTEEGTALVLEGQDFGLVTGETVQFRFFSSSVRAGDEVGVVLEDAENELDETSCLEATLPVVDEPGDVIPVKLTANVTEMGTLELWMNHLHSDQRWKLEFNVRAQ